MRALDSDIARVKREGFPALHPCHWNASRTGHSGVPIVGIKDVNILRAEPAPSYILRARSRSSSISSRSGCVVRCRKLCANGSVHVDRWLLHILGALGGGEEIGC